MQESIYLIIISVLKRGGMEEDLFLANHDTCIHKGVFSRFRHLGWVDWLGFSLSFSFVVGWLCLCALVFFLHHCVVDGDGRL